MLPNATKFGKSGWLFLRRRKRIDVHTILFVQNIKNTCKVNHSSHQFKFYCSTMSTKDSASIDQLTSALLEQEERVRNLRLQNCQHEELTVEQVRRQ